MALRRGFLKLTRVSDDGRFSRQSARWADLPGEAAPVLERLVKARLLTSDGDTVEVAHEALFRVWDELKRWLDEERQFLLWKKNTRDELDAWLAHEHSSHYVLTGARATEAAGWLASHAADLDDDEKAFLLRASRVRQCSAASS